MNEEAVQKLIEYIESASPIIWDAVYRKVYVDLVDCIFWLILCAVAVVYGVRCIKHLIAEQEPEGAWVVGIISFITAIVGAIALRGIIDAVFNPNYEAIHNLVHLFHLE